MFSKISKILFVACALILCMSFSFAKTTINTTNKGKMADFKKYLGEDNVQFINGEGKSEDEIFADKNTVAARKALDAADFFKQDGVIVEDSSLKIEGISIYDKDGVMIKWILKDLDKNIDAYIGQRATFTVSMAEKVGDKLLIYNGEVSGVIVAPRGELGFGFDKIFMPDEQALTMSEMKDIEKINPERGSEFVKFNSRYLAVQKYLNGEGEFLSVGSRKLTGNVVWQEADEAKCKQPLIEEMNRFVESSKGSLE